MISRFALIAAVALAISALPHDAAARPDRVDTNNCENLIKARIALLSRVQDRLEVSRNDVAAQVRMQRLVLALSQGQNVDTARGCSQYVVFRGMPVSPN